MAQKKSVTLNIAQPVDRTIYSQWERQIPNKGKVSSISGRTPSASYSASPIATRSTQVQSNSRNKYPISARQTTKEEDKLERIKLLELKTLSTRTAIANYKVREQELLKENLGIKRSIERAEKPDHESVKTLMRRYEKFRGGISFLNENFKSTLQNENGLLNGLECRLESELSTIQKQVNTLDEKLQQKQTQVYVLNNYKDKEYPVKAIRIGELMSELDQVEIENDDEFYDLERVIGDELTKLNQAGTETETNIKESALNGVLEKMHPSLKDKATQNQVMETEIDYHNAEILHLQEDITQLEEGVRQLIAHPKTNVRLQVFPELFKYETKCSPDMDVVLDIPKVEILPI